MTRNNRRFLYLSFMLFFFVVAPVLVLYSSGYRLDWANKRLLKTSVINLNTRPKGAAIWLNGLVQPEKTPAILTGIFPGTYDIKIAKDGFLPWQNTITVRTTRASVLYDIVLFRDTTSQLLYNADVVQFKKYPKDDQLLAVTKNESSTELNRLNLRDSSTANLITRPGTISLETDPQYDQVIISQTNIPGSYELINTVLPNSSEPLKYLPENLSGLQWLTHDTLLGLTGGRLCQVFLTKNTTACSQKDISKLFVLNSDIYYIQNDAQASYLYLTTGSLETNPPLIRLPLSNDYSLLSAEHKHIMLADSKTNDLFIIVPEGTSYRQTRLTNVVKNGFWLKNVEQFVYYNDNEIWLFDPKTAEHRLLNRVSEPIYQVSQLADLPYLIYSRAGNIESLEISEYAPTHTIIPLVANTGGWFTLTLDNTLIYQDTSERQRLWSRPLF